MGHQIGLHAHQLFPGGVLVDEEPWQHAQAVARTAALMADAAVPAVFEAAFVHDDIRIRVDVMERLPLAGGRLGAAGGQEQHGRQGSPPRRRGLAVARARRAGVPVSSAEVLHVNNGYVRGTGEVDWPAFFTRVDVAGAIEAGGAACCRGCRAMRACLQGTPASGRAGWPLPHAVWLRVLGPLHGGQARRLDRPPAAPCIWP